MKKLFNKQGSSGFTIIEVTIVLAIAGLIMAIVFVAVPALQRNAHNTQRKSDASHLAGLVNEYASNHAGTLPTALCSSSCTPTAGTLDISGEHWDIMTGTTTVVTDNTKIAYGDTKTMVIDESASCNPTTGSIAAASGNDRTFAIGFKIETSGGSDSSCVGE